MIEMLIVLGVFFCVGAAIGFAAAMQNPMITDAAKNVNEFVASLMGRFKK